MDALITQKPKSIALDAVIIRADGSREDLGTISYWHKNPLKRWYWKLTNG